MKSDLKFADLKLLPGTKIDLRSDQFSYINGICKYQGFDGKYIFISVPVVNGKQVSCKPNIDIVLRFFVNHLNCVCAFRSSIFHVTLSPSSVIMLKAPDEMEIGEVRKSVRANLDLESTINSDNEYRRKNQSASIVNLSVEGAKLESKEFLGDEGETISITTSVSVLDLEKEITLQGIIRSVSEKKSRFSYGIQFSVLDPTVKLLVYAYVMSQMI